MNLQSILQDTYENKASRLSDPAAEASVVDKERGIFNQWLEIPVTRLAIERTEQYISERYSEMCTQVLSGAITDIQLRSTAVELATLTRQLHALRQNRGIYTRG